MDILSLITDPKVVIMIVLVAIVAYLIYRVWKKTYSLEETQNLMHKQLAHGIITNEKLRHPLRIDDASNMSEETVDYEYNNENETTDAGTDVDGDAGTGNACEADVDADASTSQSETECDHDIPANFVDSLRHYRSEQSGPAKQTKQPYSRPVEYESDEVISNQDLINELRQLKRRDDFIIIDSPESQYETDDEEIIEFHEIGNMDDASTEQPALSVMLKKRDDIVKEKIQQDIERMDHENKIMYERVQASAKAGARPAPASASASASKSQAKEAQKSTPRKPKVVVKPKIKNIC